MFMRSRALLAELGSGEVVLLLGVLLVSAGLWPVWWPGALLFPGLVCVWIALPTRAPMVARYPVQDSQRRSRERDR